MPDEERIDLKPEEVFSDEDLKAFLQTEEERAIASRLLLPLVSRVNALCEARMAKVLDRQVQSLIAENKGIMEHELEKLRKANTPMTDQEMQALLGQEYMEFKVRVRPSRNGHAAEPGERQFVLHELPLAAETRVLKTIQKTLAGQMQHLATFEWDPGTTLLQRTEKIIELVPEAMEALSDCVAICLNPFGDEPGITGEWVRSNLSMSRIVSIIRGQLQVGRYRDFVSGVSQLTSSMIQ